MMKSRRIKLTIATLTCAMAFNSIALASSFTDTKGHWAKENIDSLVPKNIITGYTDGTFKPNNNITREEVSKILSSYIGEKEVENDKLNDIENRWSTKFIKHLVSEEIITGYPDGTFKPSNSVTRAEFATIVYKYLAKENKLVEGDLKALKDIEGHWAKDSIEGVVKAGYINGYPDNTFKPNNPITRAEVSKIVSLIDGFKPVELPIEKPIEPPIEKPIEPEKPVDIPVVNEKDVVVPKFKIVGHEKSGGMDLRIWLNNVIDFKTLDATFSTELVSHPQLNKGKLKDPFEGGWGTYDDTEIYKNIKPRYTLDIERLYSFNIDEKNDVKFTLDGKNFSELRPKIGEILTYHITVKTNKGTSQKYEVKIPYRNFTESIVTSGTRIK